MYDGKHGMNRGSCILGPVFKRFQGKLAPFQRLRHVIGSAPEFPQWRGFGAGGGGVNL